MAGSGAGPRMWKSNLVGCFLHVASLQGSCLQRHTRHPAGSVPLWKFSSGFLSTSTNEGLHKYHSTHGHWVGYHQSSSLSTLAGQSSSGFWTGSFPGTTQRLQRLNLGPLACKTCVLPLIHSPSLVTGVAHLRFKLGPSTRKIEVNH